MFPPFWKQDSHWPTVVFTREVDLSEDEAVTIAVEGKHNIAIDGKLQGNEKLPFTIPAGRHIINIKVWNQSTPPALFIDGPTIKTDASWEVTYEDKIWIDELGVAHGSGIYVPVGHGSDSLVTPPSQFRLPTKSLTPVYCESVGSNAVLYDFGQETFGYLHFHSLRGEGMLRVYYGESREEALDCDHCETLDILHVGEKPGSKAFRFVLVVKEDGASYDDVTIDFEYAPFDLKRSGTFRCSDDELNKIWEVSAYTLDLTTREFFCDGIKRDRWTWSGDAI